MILRKLLPLAFAMLVGAAAPLPTTTFCTAGPYVVHFAAGTAVSEPMGPEILDNILGNDAYCDGARIIVDGHIAKGEAEALAMARAMFVRAYLVEHRVAPRRVYVRGLGTTEPAPDSRINSIGSRDARVELRFAPSDDY
ncbi:MAG: OmpA family protein [Pseudomonadota bacterium]